METSLERIRKDIEALSHFNATPGCGVTRFSYSKEDRQARDYLLEQFKSLDLDVSIDGVGNIRARYLGKDSDAPIVMTGSHIDTVLNGGKFDGVAGVVGALEIVRVMHENDIRPTHSVEIVIFTEEEGSNFYSTMAGSKALTGKYGIDDLKKISNENGVSMFDVARQFGLTPENVEEHRIRPGEVKAMIELHVEQGAVLDDEKKTIGIVNAIAGMKTFVVTFTGKSNHAGTTPMYLRENPMSAAAQVISEVEDILQQVGTHSTVGTVGKIICVPNVPNVIPNKVAFTLDVRDVDPRGIRAAVAEFKKRVADKAAAHKVEVDISLIAQGQAIQLAGTVVGTIETAAQELGLTYKKMNSGAVHDSAMMAELTDVGMIFVPSVAGRSHVPEENTPFEDIKAGCDLLLKTVLRLAR